MTSTTARTAGSEALTLPILPRDTEGRGGVGIHRRIQQRIQRLLRVPKLLSVSRNPYRWGLVRWDARWRAGAFRTARLVAVDRYYQRYALIISASIRA